MQAIMGATGKVGGEALRLALAKGRAARALTRRPEDFAGLTEAAHADPLDAESLTKAFAGADAVFVMVPPFWDAADLRAEGRRAVAAIGTALRAARPAHVVALSSAGTELETGTGPLISLRDLEAELADTGLPTTLIRAADFMENWAAMAFVAAQMGLLPTVRQPLERHIETVSTADVGALVAEALAGPAPATGTRIVNALGPRKYAPAEFAVALSRVIGRPIAAVPQTVAAMRDGLVAAGASVGYADALAELYDSLNAGKVLFQPGVGEDRRGNHSMDHALSGMLAG